MMKRILFSSLMMLCSVWAYAQITVTGQVISSEGDPLIGVNIVEKGNPNNGSITDFDGNYTITVPGDAVLVFSYTGYEEQEVPVDGNTAIDIEMTEGTLLDEVVVTALGIERKKKALAYSVAEIGGESVAQAKEVNVGNALSGKIAGVNVSNPATGAGGSTRIVIRGNGNISGNNQPLIVVDGVPINNDNLGSAGMWGGSDWGDGISSLNSDDIESISVLKGNTAGALYGYRADNGVILVTTKKGTNRKGVGVEFNSNLVAETFMNNYDFQRQYGHGNRGAAPTTEAEALEFGLTSWGAPLDGSQVIQFDGQTRPYSDAGDNLSRFYRTGSTWTNSLSLSGGSETVNYRFGLTGLNNEGIVPNSGLDRYTFTTNTNGTFGKLTAGISGSYVFEDTKNRPRLSDSPGNANYTVWSLPASINVNDLRGREDKLGADETGGELDFNQNNFVTNPWWAAHQFENNNSKNRLFGNLTLAYEIAEGITIQGRAGLDRFNERRRSLEPYGTNYRPLGQITETNREVQEINLETTLRINKNINENVGIDFLVGGNQQKNRNENLGANGSLFNIPFLHSIQNVQNQSLIYGFSRFQVNSIFSQLELSLFNSLYITATGRQDWFSTLTDPNGGSSENSVFYPSLGLAYDLAEGVDLPGFVDLAKLRASYAQVGGATDPYQLGLFYRIFNQGHLGQPLGGIANGSIPPIGLVPSTNTEFEIGTDVQMFRGRLHVDLAFYSRETADGILSASISPSSGYGSKTVNVGSVTNRGVELLVEVNPIRKENFSWNLGINFAHNVNEVVSLLTPDSDGETVRLAEARSRSAYIELVEGLPYSQIVGFEYARDASGNLMLDDDGLPMQGTLRPFGTGVHPTSLGINNSFSLGNFSLSFLIDMKTGGYIYNATNRFGYSNGLHKATLEGRENGIGVVAAADVQDYYQRVANISEEFIDDADFAKLRELLVGYKLPSSLTDKLPVRDLKISFAARNLLLLWSKTDNIDPESTFATGNAQGLEMFGVPVTRSFGLNLNAKF